MNYAPFLWTLKLGALLNLYFLWNTPLDGDPYIVVPAWILFAVSAYRCLFPVRYDNAVVFHDSVFSSIRFTRALATFSEVAYIFQFAYVLRVLDGGQSDLVSVLSWLMVIQVIVSQFLVWGAIATGRLALYFYEELGWAVIFAANTIATIVLMLRAVDHLLLVFNLVFGLLYLPWQAMHLRMLRANADATVVVGTTTKQRRTDAQAWGGVVGLSWMLGYWAILIPPWVYAVVLYLK
ncbi:MAG: hypothetical protein ACREUE_00765 [Panacagrimonas sp.]